MNVTRDQDLSQMNTFGMKVKCAAYAEYCSVQELADILRDESLPRPFLHIGGGSNLLFTKDFPGTVLHSAIRFIREVPEPGSPDGEKGSVHILAGGGTPWDEVCAWCAGKGYWGPENLSAIPGETGAAAVQNIGAYGKEVKDLVEYVECLDLQTLEIVDIPVSECRYAYRDSLFKGEAKGRYAVISVMLELPLDGGPSLDYGNLREAALQLAAKEAEATEGPASSTKGPASSTEGPSSVQGLTPGTVRRAVIGIREGKLPDPAVTGSAGSFFRNPYVSAEDFGRIVSKAESEGFGPVPHFLLDDGRIKVPAAWLIDRCGWKGRRHGNAGVYDRQPLVLVNATGQASPGEILELEEMIVSSVRDTFGVELSPEVEHV